jgi:hypothetical protein
LSDILKNSGIKDAQKLVYFHMSNLDRPDKSLFDEVPDEAAAQSALGTRPARDEEQRDSAWRRWVKLFSIILVPAIVLGVVFALGDYVRQYTATMQFDRAVARGFVKLDTWDWLLRRFMLGAFVGAAFGLFYVIQRNLKNRVP